MSAEVLRRAASLMRERAEAVEVSAWSAEPCSRGDRERDYLNLGERRISFRFNAEICEHVASWHPTVALAVADWLTYVADAHDETACPAMVAAEQVASAYLGESA